MTKLNHLNQQVVWITGASSGIGKALAKACAIQGASVILSGRHFETLEQVRLTLAHPERHLGIAMDITDQHQVIQAYQHLLQCKGRIDWLINNAGLSQRALITETSMQTEYTLMEVDYFAQIFLTKTVLPTLIQQQSGRIIFISSVAGLLGTQYRASYSAAKAAIHMWANSLRAEVHHQGIDVSVIFPGFVNTNVSFNALNGAGQPQRYQDEAIEQGLDADQFAYKALKALMNGEEYIVIGGIKERLATWISRLSPRILYQVIRRAKVK